MGSDPETATRARRAAIISREGQQASSTSSIAEAAIERRTTTPSRDLSSSDSAGLELHEAYLAVRNEVLQPDRTVPTTRYFWEKWAPQLGVTLSVLIVRLRVIAADNRTARELHRDERDWCPVHPTQAELAEQLGVSEATIHRELKHPAARYFIKRIARYAYDDRLRKKVRIADAYEIAMDDPPTPDDEKGIALRAAQRIISGKAESLERTRIRQELAAQGFRPSQQNDGQVGRPNQQSDGQVGSEAPTRQFDASNDVSGTFSGERPETTLNVGSAPDRIRTQGIADQLVEELGDSRSRSFYVRVANRCPEELIWAALAETKDAFRTGRIKKSMGACFTDLVKRKAREWGVDL